MKRDNTVDAFFALVKSGLWEKDVSLSEFGVIDYQKLYDLAEEQAVTGLVAAGLEYVVDIKIPREIVLQFVGQTLLLEQQNTAMNCFVSVLIEKMRVAGIFTLLVKGQSVAKNYERPLLRSCGDVDLYMSEDNFQKAKELLRPLVDCFDPDNEVARHINMRYGKWVIEIHADQHTYLSNRIDAELDRIHYDLFNEGNIISCLFGGTQVFIPSKENDILIVFTHFIKHFYKGGLGIRQVCDWCRLIWNYRGFLDENILYKRIKKMGLFSEWKAFGAFAIESMGIPPEAMPFYDNSRRWSRKAKRIRSFIIKVGNFGCNRDMSYYNSKSLFVRKFCSLTRRFWDSARHALIFPLDSIKFFPRIVINGIHFAVNE